jgi:CheY-like chemotaxis protein
LTAAEKASVRAQDLTLQLLTFSKGGEPVKKLARLGGLLRDSISFALSGSNVKSTLAVAADLHAVFVDESQMSQVIQNVVKNAEQTMPSGGTVIVQAENKSVTREDALPVEPGRYVVVSVADTGVGILEKHLAKVFDPYFTTKDGGSGLGLASAYAIVKKHEGFITVDSARGGGTTFHIYLPAAEGAPAETSLASEAEFTGQGKILVMDDEEMILDVTTEMLERMGYTSQSARDGHDALALYKEAHRERKPFDAVILDLTVPGGMGGEETIDELKRFDPDVIAIVSSGYANDPIMADCEKHGFRGVISKPYDMQNLHTVLRKVLD